MISSLDQKLIIATSHQSQNLNEKRFKQFQDSIVRLSKTISKTKQGLNKDMQALMQQQVVQNRVK
jgi:hypothetical protein